MICKILSPFKKINSVNYITGDLDQASFNALPCPPPLNAMGFQFLREFCP